MTLEIEFIRENLSTMWIAHTMYYEPVVTSTNDLLKKLASRGEPAGTLLLTDYQSRGKGRLQRKWDAPAGSSLLFSILFRPAWLAYKGNWFTMMAGLAANNVIAATTGAKTALKWPNDIVAGPPGSMKKIGGILTESEIDDDGIRWLIMGMGLNVNITTSQLPETSMPATSLAIEVGRTLSRERLLLDLLSEIERLYGEADQGHSPLAAWREHLVTIGRRVRVDKLGRSEVVEGYAEGLNEWGHLLVRDDKGIIHTISAGDVTLSG